MKGREFPNQGAVVRSVFFLTYAGQASFLSYYYVYLRASGLTPGETGIIAAIFPVISVILLPFWGLAADNFGRKLIFSISIFCTGVFLFLLNVPESFIGFFLITCLVGVFSTSLPMLTDNLALDYSAYYQKPLYGQIRMWASLGWASASYIVGVFADKHLNLIFYAGGGILLFNWLISTIFYRLPTSRVRLQSKFNSSDIKNLLSNKKLLKFLIFLLFYGIASAPLFLLINLYYEEVGGSHRFTGLAFAIQSTSELPFFFFGGKIVQRFGALKTIFVVIAVACLRMLLSSVAPSAEIVLVLAVLHGVCIGLFLVAAISYIQDIVPAEKRSTGQSLLYMFYFGAGIMLGSLIIGFLNNVISMKAVMAVHGFLALIVLIAGYFSFRSKTVKINKFRY